ncbi:MAG: hypothetical protein AB9856_17855 [Cellulosilyticaceae bacterium]
MNPMYAILIVICIIAIIVLVFDLAAVFQNKNKVLKIVCLILFAFSMMRYLTLIIYGNSPNASQLEILKYFYLATSIGLAIPTASAIWYITPMYRCKIQYVKYLLLFTPWIIFDSYVLITQPTKISVAPSYGYILALTGKFPMYSSIAKGSFAIIIIMLCLIGFLKYKNEQLRSQYFVLIMAQILLVLDGVMCFMPLLETLPKFTISEIIGFLGIFYALKKRPL